MATAFRRKGGRLVGKLEPEELEVVLELLRLTRGFVAPEEPSAGEPGAGQEGESLRELVAGLGDEGPVPEPEDPALRRLLPPAHRDDPEQAADFRRLTQHSLRSRKAATLATAVAALEEADPPVVSLDEGQAHALVVGLTDVRLVLGERLGLETDEDAERLHEMLQEVLAGREPADVDPHLVQQAASYDFLTWLQETLTSALLR
ncbi:DUF2017 family protein [Ornithinicoccus halotolerans]|uniref:DUF2017 family protein n=1 Tax=Ornithinicoccus halotolerans TaxID=1748220 RepID=UPI001297B2C8|nr:DUF2017 family protein [Ornithinicoccus halotolerans]